VTVSRRQFLSTGTLVSLSAVIPRQGIISVFAQEPDAGQLGQFKVPPGIQPDERLTEDNFSRYLYSEFRFSTSPFTEVSLQLVNVKRWEAQDTPRAQKTKLDSFSVLFKGPRKTALESNTYQVTHDWMGTFDLFISPVNDRKKQRIYQAVFNRFQS
jgi:uncharacterized protein DUF6916